MRREFAERLAVHQQRPQRIARMGLAASEPHLSTRGWRAHSGRQRAHCSSLEQLSRVRFGLYPRQRQRSGSRQRG